MLKMTSRVAWVTSHYGIMWVSWLLGHIGHGSQDMTHCNWYVSNNTHRHVASSLGISTVLNMQILAITGIIYQYQQAKKTAVVYKVFHMTEIMTNDM